MEEAFLNHRFVIMNGPTAEDLAREYFGRSGLSFTIFEDTQNHEEQSLTLRVDFMTELPLNDDDDPKFDCKIHELRGPADEYDQFDFVSEYNIETRTGWIEFHRPERKS